MVVDPEHEKKCFKAAFAYFLAFTGQRQQDVWQALGLSQQQISNLKKGKRTGGEDSRILVAKHYGFSYDDFLSVGRQITILNDCLLNKKIVPTVTVSGIGDKSAVKRIGVEAESTSDLSVITRAVIHAIRDSGEELTSEQSVELITAVIRSFLDSNQCHNAAK